MKGLKEMAKKFIVKYGATIVSCAFVFATISANSSCLFPFYEPEEPNGLDQLKKFNR